jgi:hypothetical protein
MEDPGSGQNGSPDDTFVNNTCPNCRSDFVPESYFVLQSAEPLMQRMQSAFQI